MKYDYRTQYYFPSHVVTAGHAAIFFGMVLAMMVHWFPGVLLMFVGFFIVSMNYGLTVDIENKKYKDYLFCLGMKFGEYKNYEEIEYFYITCSKVTTTMQLRAASSELTHMEFNGYIKFSEDQKVHLVSSKRKRKVLIFLERMASDLNVKIMDLSGS